MATYTLRFYETNPEAVFSTSVGSTFLWFDTDIAPGIATITDNETGIEETTLDDDGLGGETATANVTLNGLTSTGTGVDAERVWTIRDTETGDVFEVAQLDVESGGASGRYTLSEMPLVQGRTYEVVDYSDNANVLSGDPAFSYLDFVAPGNEVTGGDGNDTIDASYNGDPEGDQIDDGLGGGASGNDNIINALGGNDTITAGAGDDTVLAGAGSDTVDGGTGADEIRGGDGDDTLIGGTGDDVLIGGGSVDIAAVVAADDFDDVSAWDHYPIRSPSNEHPYGPSDSLGSPSGDNALVWTTTNQFFAGNYGGVWQPVAPDNLTLGETYQMSFWARTDGPDSSLTVSYQSNSGGSHNFVSSTASIDGEWQFFEFTATLDEIHNQLYIWGNDPNTTYAIDALEFVQVSVTTDDDDLDGGIGNDTLDGGDGDDTLTGGADNDQMTGGAGDDVFALADGSGADTITDFDTGDSNFDGFFNDQLDVTALTDAFGNPVNAWDVTVTDDGSGNALLTFPNGETLVLTGVAPAEIDEAQEKYAAGIVCFTEGTLIATPAGEVPIETLRPGDLVNTQDSGPQPVLWMGHRDIGPEELRAHPALKPVKVPAGVLGNHTPLLVSPQHGLLVDRQHGAAGPSFARAKHLAEAKGPVRVAAGKKHVRYVHMLFERHAIVWANGALSESFYPGPDALLMLTPEDRANMLRHLPALAHQPVETVYGPTARPFLSRKIVLQQIALQRAQVCTAG